MREHLPDFEELAASLPCDEDLLPELGRATWAATLLHHDVVELLGKLRGRPVERPVDLSLAAAVRDLGRIADQDGRSAIAEWCRSIGRAAASSRDGVLHRIVQGTPIDDLAPSPPRPYDAGDLNEVSGRLVNAARTLRTAEAS